MLVDFPKAVKVFNLLPNEHKSPYLHPYYVMTDALRDRNLKPVFFIYKDGGEIFYHAFHLGKVKGTLFNDIQSPYAYGGPLSSTHDVSFLAGAWQDYISWCRVNNILAEFVRFHPCLENWRYYPGGIHDMRDTVWIDLSQPDLFNSYNTRVKTAIRKAQKNGLLVEWVSAEHSYRLFHDLYIQSLDLLQADHFYYFPWNYIKNLQDWRNSYLAVCSKDQEVLAAALFIMDVHIMEYHLSASNLHGKKYSASNLLLNQAANMARERGCRIMHLGGGTDNQTDNPLLFYKAGFSHQRALFRIGKIIHEPEAYQKMQGDWQDRYGKCSEKTLFYRFPPG